MNRIANPSSEPRQRKAPPASVALLRTGLALFTAFTLLGAAAAQADELRCAGVLGNSGEQGATLVRFGPPLPPASGMGVAFDRYGTLWDRGGTKTLNRYAVDGRQLATYPIAASPGDGRDDTVTLAGETLLLKIGRALYALSIDAPAGTAPSLLEPKVFRLSLSTHDGWAAATDDTRVFLVNAQGETRPVAPLETEASQVEIAPDGAVYVQFSRSRKVRRFQPGTTTFADLAESLPGDRPQRLGEYWYGHRWGSTIWRFDTGLKPTPGVVLGGASGSFLGHLALNSEVTLGRGMAQLRPDLYAVSGFRGVLQLLEWKPAEKQMEIVRRIGAIQTCDGLGLDREGRVWHAGGTWEWQDGADTPMRPGVPQPEAIFGITMLDNDRMVAYLRQTNKPAIFFGPLKSEVTRRILDRPTALPKTAVAVAVSESQKQPTLLVLEKDGKCTAVFLNPNGDYKGEAGPVELKTSSPLKEWKSLVSIERDKLLAAADGFIVEFGREGDQWRETLRWNSWGSGPDEKFGDQIQLSADAGRLWVSDTGRQRVLCLDAATHSLLGCFGRVDTAGDDLASLNAPQQIAARGKRGVVFDSGNQRLLKLELKEK